VTNGLILVAGQSTRLRGKCLLTVGGLTILDRAIKNLVPLVDNIILVVNNDFPVDEAEGYIKCCVGDTKSSGESLLRAGYLLTDGSYILEGDIVSDPLPVMKHGEWLAVSGADGSHLKLDKNGRVRGVRYVDTPYKSAGVIRVSEASAYLDRVDSDMSYDVGAIGYKLRLFSGKWVEVDTKDDLERARAIFG